MTIYIERSAIREACALLRDDANCLFNLLSDVTAVDWYPSEPRFEVVYHLFSIRNKERVRLKVRLNSDMTAAGFSDVSLAVCKLFRTRSF
jgi:NADH-quinone oxidoreductase subunit C